MSISSYGGYQRTASFGSAGGRREGENGEKAKGRPSGRRLEVPPAPAHHLLPGLFQVVPGDMDLLDGAPVLRVDTLLDRFAHGEQARLVGDRGQVRAGGLPLGPGPRFPVPGPSRPVSKSP